MREKVLLKIILLEHMTWGLAFSLLGAYVVREFLNDDAVWLGYALVFACGLGTAKCVVALMPGKTLPAEPKGTVIYEHETEWKGIRKLGKVPSRALFILFWMVFSVWCVRLLPHDTLSFRLLFAGWAMICAAWVLKRCKTLCGYYGYDPKIKIALSRQELSVSYPNEDFLSSLVVFRLDEIADAGIAEYTGRFKIRANEKNNRGPYVYAFFLSGGFPLPDGHQAVDLKLRNSRRVLIETDDAENFIDALKNCGSFHS
jgi:hypothetical protein